MDEKTRRHVVEINDLRATYLGQRVVLVRSMAKDPDHEKGDRGTVYKVDKAGRLHVAWDDGSRGKLVTEIDEFERLGQPVN